MKKRGPVVGVDLGGTKMLACVVDRKGRILSEVKRPTPTTGDASEVLARLAKTVRRAIRDAEVTVEDVLAVGVGAPAPVDSTTGRLGQATNVPALTGFPLGKNLGRELELPVVVDNDVNVGTVGEHALGAGRGTKDMVGIFVGTGTGGAVILDGRLRRGFRDSAGEVGHMVVAFQGRHDEPHCGCGSPGCLEAYASRTSIERDIRAAVAAGRDTVILDMLEESGKKRITSGLLKKALARHDPLVSEIFQGVTTHLSLLVASIVNLLDPEMLVIGGGVAEALGDKLVGPIRRDAPRWYLNETRADEVQIVLAELGDYAGILGAAVIARQYAEDPAGA